MTRYVLATLLLFVAVPVEAQPLLHRRAATVIASSPIPADATAVAYLGSARFGFVTPYYVGAYAGLGRGIIYQRSPDGTLHSPRIIRSASFAVAGQYGIGFPFSLSLREEIFTLTTQERDAILSRPHWQGRVQVGVAAMVPGYLFVAQVGPTWGSRPGVVIHDRSLHLGLFASVFVVGEVGVTWADRRRR